MKNLTGMPLPPAPSFGGIPVLGLQNPSIKLSVYQSCLFVRTKLSSHAHMQPYTLSSYLFHDKGVLRAAVPMPYRRLFRSARSGLCKLVVTVGGE